MASYWLHQYFCILCVTSFVGYSLHAAVFPTRSEVEAWSSKTNRVLTELVSLAAHLDGITEAYERQASMIQRDEVDRMGITRDVASKLAKIMNLKMRMLRKSVEAAEAAAADHEENPFLAKEQVSYVAAKKIPDNDTRLTYSAQFQQNVALNFSSVHIPVEIYEGDPQILNSLNWSSRLDEQWIRNREEDPTLLWQYFGSQTGFMRTLPASRWKGDRVDLYDVRRRPWYTQGTSSPKDMMILIDTSGSTHGQALALMKVAVKSLLDTLGENDFVYISAFSDRIHNVSCFTTFVQANYRNKKMLSSSIDHLKAGGMAMYSLAFEFAFTQITKFRRDARKGQGAQCNQVIMLLTDGGTEMPTDVFKRHNWPKQQVRVFTYAIGPTANPIAAVKWMACANRGYFSKIPAMGAIRTRVQEYVNVIGRVTALAKHPDRFQWADISDDPHHRSGDGVGLGMMTTVTLPVYDRGDDRRKNQTILGVMGVDVTVKEMEEEVPHWKLGPNGYGFAINGNGYIVFHPYLKSGKGYLKDPPNVDFLEVEVDTEGKNLIRNFMIDNQTGEKLIENIIIAKDELHVSKMDMWYSYTGIEGTSFSVGIVVPKDHKYYIDIKNRRIRTNNETLLENLIPRKAAVLLSSWDYCKNITGYLLENTSDSVNILKDWAKTKPQECKQESLRHLLYDALITKSIEELWEQYDGKDISNTINAYFLATEGGLTRVFPASEGEAFQEMRGTTMDAYYQRAFNFKKKFVFTAPNAGYPSGHTNGTTVSILGVKTVELNDARQVYPAVAGVKINYDWFESEWMPYCPDPQASVCYLLDDGGFVVSTNQLERRDAIGQFFGDVDLSLMSMLYNGSIYERIDYYDYQSICPKKEDFVSAAGARSFNLPSMAPFYDALSAGWWASRVSWTYLSYNVYNWAFSSHTVDAYSEEEEDMHLNISCIKKSGYYFYSEGFTDTGSSEQKYECNNCSRRFIVSRLPDTNLLMVVAEPECLDCLGLFMPLPQKPVEDPGPDICTAMPRYRARPGDCHSHHEMEDTTDCGGAGTINLSMGIIFLITLLHLMRHHDLVVT